MPTFDSAGVPIHYEVFGEGRPIVLVHGFASSLRENWVAPGWIETLRPIRRVAAALSSPSIRAAWWPYWQSGTNVTGPRSAPMKPGSLEARRSSLRATPFWNAFPF